MEIVTAKTNEKDSKTNRETALRDFVRFAWRTTRGLTDAAESESKDLVRKLVASGRVTPQEGEQLLSGLMIRMQASQQQFEERINTIVQRTVEKIQDVSRTEVSALSADLSEVEHRLERLWAKKRAK